MKLKIKMRINEFLKKKKKKARKSLPYLLMKRGTTKESKLVIF